MKIRHIKERPKPFPTSGISDEPQENQQIFDEEARTFKSFFRDIKSKYSKISGKLKRQLKELEFWSEEIINAKDKEGREEAFITLNNTKEKIKETIAAMNDLSTVAASPYFGRIDVTFDDKAPKRYQNKTHTFYIGKKGQTFSKHKLTDWRAPVSSLYYNYPTPEDNAFYKTDKQIIEVDLEQKRKIEIEDGRLLHAFDSSEVSSLVGSDPFLLRQLTKGASSKLKDIISTIQSEQNKIISMEPDKDLVIQGVAGSGKTSIAVHRLSWLLYNYKSTIEAHRCLIIAPSKLFLHYIADILPEIGSEKVPQMTFRDWAMKKLRLEMKELNDGDILDRSLDERAQEKATIEFMREVKQVGKKLARKKDRADIMSEYQKFVGSTKFYESDLAPLVYLKFLVTGVLPSEKIHYLVVDEAQDHTPAEIFILKKYTEEGRTLLVGDLLQGIINPNGVDSWNDLMKFMFKRKESLFFKIRTSYRTTKSIVEFVNKRMLERSVPSNYLPKPVLREGIPPTVLSGLSIDEILDQISQIVARERERGFKNIAIIVPEKHLDMFTEELRSTLPDLSLVDEGEDLYDGGVVVSHVKLFKGLEFDSVIFVNYPEWEEDSIENKKFYTACTRAMHNLYVFEEETPNEKATVHTKNRTPTSLKMEGFT